MSDGPFRAVMDRVAQSDLSDADKAAVLLCLGFAEANALAVIARGPMRAVFIEQAQDVLKQIARAMERVEP